MNKSKPRAEDKEKDEEWFFMLLPKKERQWINVRREKYW